MLLMVTTESGGVGEGSFGCYLLSSLGSFYTLNAEAM